MDSRGCEFSCCDMVPKGEDIPSGEVIPKWDDIPSRDGLSSDDLFSNGDVIISGVDLKPHIGKTGKGHTEHKG